MTQRAYHIVAGALLVSACFFQFVLVGYQTIALLLLGFAGEVFLLGLVRRRWFQRFLIGLTITGLLAIGAIEIPIITAAGGAEVADASCVIVLGAGVNGDVPSLSLHNRLVAAKQWLDAHPDSYAILSGGQGTGETISEAEAMYRWLVAQGIAPERLRKEEASSTTRENFLYSAELLREYHNGELPTPVAVVSSEYHLYRAMRFARQAGLEPLGVPAKTTLPVLRLNYFLRESAAVARLWILGY